MHHAAVLIGYGAGAVCPWLALETARGMDAQHGEQRMLHSFELGLAKVMSKMGISVLDSYRGAQLFDALGLDSEVMETCFAGTASPIGRNRLRWNRSHGAPCRISEPGKQHPDRSSRSRVGTLSQRCGAARLAAAHGKGVANFYWRGALRTPRGIGLGHHQPMPRS